jgi:hypothetical protein
VTAQPRHYCRNPRCRSKLKAPVENHHHAFCCRGCHASFYLRRCLVCEAEIRRKRDDQKFGSGHATCRAEYRRFPHVYDLSGRSLGNHPGDARLGGRNADKIRVERRTFWRDEQGRGWRWEEGECFEGTTVPIELRLLDRDGKLAARIEASVGTRYRLTHPITAPVLSAPDLEAGKRLAISMALANLPLDPVGCPY